MKCKKCGNESTLGIHNRITEEWEPIDICNGCIVYGTVVQPEKIIELEDPEIYDATKDFDPEKDYQAYLKMKRSAMKMLETEAELLSECERHTHPKTPDCTTP